MFSGSWVLPVPSAAAVFLKTCRIGRERNLAAITASAALSPAPTIKTGSQQGSVGTPTYNTLKKNQKNN
jgi:hypothetical protein